MNKLASGAASYEESRIERDELALWQAAQLHAGLPLLGIAIIVNTLAMATAVLGDLPWWQQLFPPLTIIATMLAVLAWRWARPAATDPERARAQLRNATAVGVVLGLVNGAWGVNAFSETEQYYCMVAPVFLGLSALISASCLLSVPRAAIAAMVCTMVPIVTKMALYDNLGVRAMAAMAIGLTVMQSGVVLSNFRQSRRTLQLQRELSRMAATDPLTGLANRRAFEAGFEDLLASGEPIGVLMLDLNGFKEANDRYGHHLGDRILMDVARRLEAAAPAAPLIARVGGDEFCIVVPDCRTWRDVMPLIEAVAVAVARPLEYPEASLTVTTSIGAALASEDGYDPDELLKLADTRLYADKRNTVRRSDPEVQTVAA